MPETHTHILQIFNNALSELEGEILKMGALVERNLRNAKAALLQRDEKAGALAILDDEEIDLLEKEIDRVGIELLRRFQPVASDLRNVISAIKLNGNLERIADQAKNIAKRARALNHAPELPQTVLLEPLFDHALAMHRDILHAFANRSVESAVAIKARDNELDQLNHALAERLTQEMAAAPERIAHYLDLIFVSRNLERVGDHIKNIAEDIVYAISAEDIRHAKATAARQAQN